MPLVKICDGIGSRLEPGLDCDNNSLVPSLQSQTVTDIDRMSLLWNSADLQGDSKFINYNIIRGIFHGC